MIALVPTHYSRAIARIGDALERHAPEAVTVKRINPMRKDSRLDSLVPGEAEGDIVVLFCNGLRDHQQTLAERCLARGQRYAVVQIALRTTKHPSTDQWRGLWGKAATVWSYYDLQRWVHEDGGRTYDFPFYHAPLGVDASIFRDRKQLRTYTVCTSGQRRSQEGVGECDDAAKAVGGMVFQLGPQFEMRAPTTFITGISDDMLATLYSKCKFVSGLRRHEGFELPAAEGLLCGARPVLFDQPHYRMWYEPWGEFVREEDPGSVTRQLIQLFQIGPRPVSAEERAAAAAIFDWQSIVRGFWAEVLSG